jgi:hypothetical protein
MLSNSCIVRQAVNDMKSNGFLDNYSMKAKGEPVDDKRLIIKLLQVIMRDLIKQMFGEYVYSVRLKNRIQELMLKASLYNKMISIYTKQIVKSGI